MKFLFLLPLLALLSGCTLFNAPENAPSPQVSPESTTLSSSTTPKEGEGENNSLTQMIVNAREKESQKGDPANIADLKTANLTLETKEITPGTITVSVVLKNPQQGSVTSLQSWVSYPKEKVKGESITLAKNSPFQLVAPGEKDFDEKLGLVKIGLSIPEGKTFSDIEAEIATITFTRVKEGAVPLEFFNPGDIGNTRVMSITESGPKNILDEKQIKPIFVE